MNANVRETTKRIIPAKSVKCSDHNTNNIHHNVAMSGVTPNIPHFSHYTLHYTAGARQPQLHTNIPASV